ncbi:MAG: hypothetical protein OXD54_07705 [Candidatus Poribacteria bacterium]|nr:hypothetical protein [Candidatus Poribacteria bacterium]
MKSLKTILALLILFTMTSIAFAGNITGTVTYEGDVPARAALTINTQEQHCITATEGAKSEALVVSKGKGIQNVVISVRTRAREELKMPKENPKVDQVGCRYLPHVLVVPVGVTVTVTSSDPVAHNVHSHAEKNEAPNVQIASKGKTYPYTITKAEAIKLTCDIHAWMSGYIVAVDSNYYTVTGQKDEKDNYISPDDYEKSSDAGKYTIKDVPAGRARVIAWHEDLGSANTTVEVPATGDISVDFKSTDFKKPKKK